MNEMIATEIDQKRSWVRVNKIVLNVNIRVEALV